MPAQIQIENVLVIDIETVPVQPKLENLPSVLQTEWNKKVGRMKEENQTAEEFYFQKAGIYAEFAKIICISAGAFSVNKTSNALNLRVKSFYGHDEKKLLLEFIELLNLHYNDRTKHYLCGHNAKEFDIPFLCRRMMVNNLLLPKLLDISGMKPWEVLHQDTMEMWKFGDKKNFTSLNLLAAVFNIPSPKQDIDGSQVGRVYWEEDNLQRIVSYCQMDVVTTAQLFLKFKGIPLMKEESINFVK